MEKVIHRASGRGKVQKGWLTTFHQFNFAGFDDPERKAFGTLEVLDENMLKPGKGFEMHSHENVEIVTIPLEGALEHMDSMGYGGVIRKHDVQVMSAGTGVYHSEFNHSHKEGLHFLQFWIRSKERGIQPRYEQLAFLPDSFRNRFQLVVSPREKDGALWINQDAWISMGNFSRGRQVHYGCYRKGHGIYVLLISGKLLVEGETIGSWDGIGITGRDALHLEFKEDSRAVILEVPLF
jgi:hypothetical protein